MRRFLGRLPGNDPDPDARRRTQVGPERLDKYAAVPWTPCRRSARPGTRGWCIEIVQLVQGRIRAGGDVGDPVEQVEVLLAARALIS